MSKLLVLGAGTLQIPAITTGKRLGLDVVALDGDPHAPGLPLADQGLVVDLLDAAACLAVARKLKPAGVVHICSEVAMPALGAINESLGLHGPDRATVVRATNKAHMRRAFEAGNAPTPMSIPAATQRDALCALRSIGRPCIVKPSRSSGSRGVTLVDNSHTDEAFVRAFDRALVESRDCSVVVEEYVDGPEFSVEILAWDGTTRVLAITDKLTTGAPNFVETGHSQPTRLAPASAELVVDAALRGVKALGLNWTAAHAEVKLSERGPFIMEIGARLGGDFITTELVPRSTGVDMVAAAIQLALGTPPDLQPFTRPKGAAIRYLTPSPGRVESISGIDEARAGAGIKMVRLDVGPGDFVPEITSSLARVGHVITEGHDAQAAILSAEAACALIHIATCPP